MEVEVSTPRSLSFRFNLLVMAADPKESKNGSRDGRAQLAARHSDGRHYDWETSTVRSTIIPQLLGVTRTSNLEGCDSFNMPQLSGQTEGRSGGRVALKGLSKDTIRELRNKGEVSCAECRR